MKRFVLSLMTAALLCLSMTCLAEAKPDAATIDRFTDVWVDDAVAVEIWYEDGMFHCRAVLGDGSDTSTVVRYETCRYDAEADALECAGGTRAIEHYDEAVQALISDVQAEDLSATLAFDAQGRMIWDDCEGIARDFTLLRLSDAEELDYRAQASVFLGRWVCDRAVIEFTEDNEAYRAFITWGSDYRSRAEWRYACVYDDMENVMEGTGTMANVTYGEDGQEVSREVLYEDGRAAFAIKDGRLIWNDMKENAGSGMAFERD